MPAYFINEFFANPAGKGATFLNIKAVQKQFDERYEQMVKKIICSSCITKKEIYVHVRIPSSVEGIYYDVVLQFTPTAKSAGVSVEDMEMRMFSNSPSFLYTYAYAYFKHDALINEFRRKLSSKMLTDIAKAKNPYGVLSYDFSIYAALKYTILNGYTNIIALKNISETASFASLYKNVQNADTLQKNRKMQNDFNKLVKKQEEQERKDAIKNPKYVSTKSDEQKSGSHNVPKAKSSPIAKNSKRTGTVKHVKKV